MKRHSAGGILSLRRRRVRASSLVRTAAFFPEAPEHETVAELFLPLSDSSSKADEMIQSIVTH
ncbi:hypothetical protein BA011_01200 [Rhizobium leguminosarum]|uniref:Uncharacterized protein n=1 Tax=Rhizobium leguminosarum TaxID=384 RepID=A0A1B1C438_RHILE|nr:hypothetical protein BA011_01200 [Rhizobium leguminosarum]